MQFSTVLNDLLPFFARENIRFAIAGGVALQALGHARLTFDIDFIVDRMNQEKIVTHMEEHGYETLRRSEGYSNHVSRELGRVDFIYIEGSTADKIFRTTTEQTYRGYKLFVPRPEHLAAMKILAMKNDPSRKYQEMIDLAFIWSLSEVNRDEIRNYFVERGMLKEFNELTGKA